MSARSRRCRRPRLSAIALLLLFRSSLPAATIVVAPAGGDFDEVAAAMAAALDGDTVLIEPGEYEIRAPLDFGGRRMTLRSTQGPEATTIRFAGAPGASFRESILIFSGGETAATVVEGLTLRGGLGSGACLPCVRRGGALWIEGAAPTLRRLRITECRAAAGGAVFVGADASPRFEDCAFFGNRATAGGGVYVEDRAAASFIGCELRANQALNGGGAFLGAGTEALFEDCSVSSNTADEGGGLALEGNAARFVRTRIAGNDAEAGGGLTIQFGAAPVFEGAAIFGNAAVEIGGGFFCAGSQPVFRDVLLASNQAPRGGAFHAERSRLELDRVTITENRSAEGGQWPSPRVMSIEKWAEASRMRNSIVWSNYGDTTWLEWSGQGPSFDVAHSCVDFPYDAPGMIQDDPLLCPGWEIAGDAWVDPAALGGREGRDGSAASPYASLAEVFERYRIALDPESPCRGAGEGGADIGAAFGTGDCGRIGAGWPRIRLAPGTYRVAGLRFDGGVSLEGAGWDRTTLLGTVRALLPQDLARPVLSGVTVSGGTEGGVWVWSPEAILRDCRIIRNAGPGVIGSGQLENCLIAESFRGPPGSEWSEGHGVQGDSWALDRSTVARNAGAGVAGSNVSIDRSIVWGNGGGSFTAAEAEVARSVVEGGWPSGVGVIATAPGFCGWLAEAELEIRTQEDLDRAVERTDYSYAVAAGSPVLGQEIGADTGVCAAPGAERVTLRLGRGSFAIDRSLVDVDLAGSGRGATILGGGGAVESPGDVRFEWSHVTVDDVSIRGRVVLGGGGILVRGVDVAGAVSVESGSARFEDCFILGGVLGDGSDVIHVSGRLDLDHCTIAGGDSRGIAVGHGAEVSISSSIVWRNAGGGIGVQPADGGGPGGRATVRYSCVDGGWAGEGNIAADPRFCGVPAGTFEIAGNDALAAALRDDDFDYALASDSPCLSSGEAGTRMGADTGACEARGAPVYRLAPGHYSLWGIRRFGRFVIRGSSRDDVVLTGIEAPLGDGAVLENLTVEGSELHAASGARPSIRAVRVESSGGAGIVCRSDSALAIEDVVVTACTGAGIVCEAGATPRIARSTIAANLGRGIELSGSARPVIEGSIVWGNAGGSIGGEPAGQAAVRYSSIEGGWTGEGNIALAPGFCGWTDAAAEIADGGALAAALRADAFSLALAPDSPCLRSGEGGARMGADTGGCDREASGTRTLRLAAGAMGLPGGTHRLYNTEIVGAGRDLTVVDFGGGIVVHGRARLAGLTIASGFDVSGWGDAQFEGVSARNGMQVRARGSVRFDDALLRGVSARGEASVAIHRSTIVRSYFGPGLGVYDSARVSLESSIVWDHGGLESIHVEGQGAVTVRYSFVEGSWPGLGNRSTDPRFCDWMGPADLAVSTSSELAAVLSSDPSSTGWALLADSPCLSAGPGGGRVGAETAICDRDPELVRRVALAPGVYAVGGSRAVEISLLGPDREAAAVEGLPPLRGRSAIEGLAIRGGAGLSIADGAQVALRRAAVEGGAGAGIVAARDAELTLDDVLVVDNGGSGLRLGERSRATIIHSTIAGNYGPALEHAAGARVALRSTIVWANDRHALVAPAAAITADHSSIESAAPWPGQGNINAAPGFCGFPVGVTIQGLEDLAGLVGIEFDAGLAAGSPCIGAAHDGGDIGARTGRCESAGEETLVASLPAGRFNGASQPPALPRAVEIRGAGTEQTTIEGGLSWLRSNTTLADLRVEGGVWAGPNALRIRGCVVNGGGIACGAGGAVTVESTRVLFGEVRADGAGAWISLRDCLVRALGGGSAAVQAWNDARVRLERCVVDRGIGGLFCGGVGASSIDAVGSILRGTTGDSVVHAASGRIELTGSTIADNSTAATAVANAGIVVLRNCIVWNNSSTSASFLGATTARYSAIEGGRAGTGNIAADPRFCRWSQTPLVWVDGSAEVDGDGTAERPFRSFESFDGFGDDIAAVFDHYGLAEGSPCLGAGEGGVDMGASAARCAAAGTGAVDVRVAPGRYWLPGGILGSIGSLAGTSAENTVLMGPLAGLRDGAVLSDFTIERGLFVSRDRDLEIHRCLLPEIHVDVRGRLTASRSKVIGDSGIFVSISGELIASGCEISGNTRGISLYRGAKATIDHCVIVDNDVGVEIEAAARATISETLIASHGRDLVVIEPDAAQLSLRFSTITGSRIGFGIRVGPTNRPVTSKVDLVGCLVANGRRTLSSPAGWAPTATGSLIEGRLFSGEGNLEGRAPRFVGPGDYRLQPFSPGYNDGPTALAAAELDLAGEPRIACGQVDVGAYESQSCPDHPYRRGEATGDGNTDISDAVAVLRSLFLGDGPLECEKAADANDDAKVDIADPVRLLGWLFLGGDALPPPIGECGLDPTADRLGCLHNRACE